MASGLATIALETGATETIQTATGLEPFDRVHVTFDFEKNRYARVIPFEEEGPAYKEEDREEIHYPDPEYDIFG